MNIEKNTRNNIKSSLLHWITNGILIFMITFLLLTQISCSENTESSKNKIKADILEKTKKMRAARKAEALSSVKLGYVDQSKIISNGKNYGVKILATRLTARGYMLDFRFHIFDIEKAKEIMQRKVQGQLTIEKDNSKLRVPVSYKLGALRQSGNNLVENKNYFMFFANPGGRVKPGDLVTFELGGFKAEHITVN